MIKRLFVCGILVMAIAIVFSIQNTGKNIDSGYNRLQMLPVIPSEAPLLS